MNDTSSIGERLRQARTERGLSRDQLAERSGKSAAFIADIEQDRRRPGIATVFRLASALGVQPSRLLDQRDRLETRDRERGILAVRDALLAPGDLPGLDLDDDGPAAPLERLEAALEAGWELYWAGRLADLAALLPPLLRSCRATEREIGAPACRPLAQACQLAADLMVHMGNDDLAFAGAMRAMRAAARGDDPLQEATLAGTANWVLLHQGRLDYAEKAAAAAAERIRPRGKAGMGHLCVYGALLLSAAAPAAAAGKADAVGEYMAEAHVPALQFTNGDRHDYNVSFGPSQIAMQAAHQGAVLHRPRAALRAAGRVNRADLRSISWGALNLDIAQACLDDKQPGEAISALWEAYQVSPEWARHQGLWRDSVAAATKRRHDRRVDQMRAAAGLPR